MTTIPSFQVRTDSEKHTYFALTHRARWVKRALSAKRFQTDLEAARRKLDEQALSNMQCACTTTRVEERTRRTPSEEIRSCEVEKQVSWRQR